MFFERGVKVKKLNSFADGGATAVQAGCAHIIVSEFRLSWSTRLNKTFGIFPVNTTIKKSSSVTNLPLES